MQLDLNLPARDEFTRARFISTIGSGYPFVVQSHLPPEAAQSNFRPWNATAINVFFSWEKFKHEASHQDHLPPNFAHADPVGCHSECASRLRFRSEWGIRDRDQRSHHRTKRHIRHGRDAGDDQRHQFWSNTRDKHSYL
jgi:hypothetical protein